VPDSAPGKSKKILVHGALGRMGREVLSAISGDSSFETVGAVDLKSEDSALTLPDGISKVPISKSLDSVLENTNPDVVVDFSSQDAVSSLAQIVLNARVNLVVGTTGITESQCKTIDILAKENNVGAIIAPNFALGAVLLLQISREVSRFFDYAEVIETHHEAKLDAPSGTAMAIAKAMREGKNKDFSRVTPEKEILGGSRGADVGGVSIHSVRMPGKMARHEVTFGAAGQTFSMTHDTINRECYMPGVLIALNAVTELKGLMVGLENILDLK